MVYSFDMAKADDYEFTVRAQTGSWFQHRTSDFHAYPFGVHGYYEWRNWAVALALCRPGHTVVEIGSNIGTETVGFADIVGPTGRVLAFEPFPSHLTALRRLIKLNPQHRIEVFPAAAGDRCATLKFVKPPARRSSGIGHLLGAGETPQHTIEVDCVTLDSVAAKLGRTQVLYIDAEGAETSILRGGRQWIADTRPFIVLEASPKLLVRAGSSLIELHALLKGWGYDTRAIELLGLGRVDQVNQPRSKNWVCFPSGQGGLAAVVAACMRQCALLPCIAGLNPLSRQ